MLNRRAFLGTVGFLIASGCAQRGDWIGGTLITVDATGPWVGTWDRPYGAGGFIMTLQQIGPKVIEDISLSGWNAGLEWARRGNCPRRRPEVQPARRAASG